MHSLQVLVLCALAVVVHGIGDFSRQLRARPHASATDSCCDCPCMDFERISSLTNEYHKNLVQAIEEHNRGKHEDDKASFWLVEGTLISALRYGAQSYTFPSGKTNLVDDDIDVAVVCPAKDRDPLFRRFSALMKQSGWTYEPNTKLEFIESQWSPLMLPQSCTDCSPGEHLKGDLHWVDVERSSDGELRYMPYHRSHLHELGVFAGTTNPDDTLNKDMIFPLQRGSWGGIEGSIIPRQATKYVQSWNNGEYGIPWEVPADSFATGDYFSCHCALDSEDQKHLWDVAQDLNSKGLASFIHDYPKHSA